MPGINTPQFDWIRAKLLGQPRPISKRQRPEWVNPDRKDKLFERVADDHGAHGSFNNESCESSAELCVSEHKKDLGLAALGAAEAAGVGFMLASRSGNGDSPRRGKKRANQRS